MNSPLSSEGRALAFFKPMVVGSIPTAGVVLFGQPFSTWDGFDAFSHTTHTHSLPLRECLLGLFQVTRTYSLTYTHFFLVGVTSQLTQLHTTKLWLRRRTLAARARPHFEHQTTCFASPFVRWLPARRRLLCLVYDIY